MLKKLFTSNVRIKLLKFFLLNPEQENYIRQLTRDLDEQINSIRRELDNLKKIGLLRSRTRLRKKYFFVNKDFIFYNELRAMFQKSERSIPAITKKIASFGDVKMLVLSGLFIDQDDAVDLLIVGSVDREDLTEYLNNELSFKRPVKFTILTQDDFEYRIKCKDKFVAEIISAKENLIPIKKLDSV